MAFRNRKSLRRRIEAALGTAPADLILRNVTYLDVFAARWRQGDVVIADGVVVALEPGLKAAREVDGRGKTVVPGFIDAHVHVESSLVVPANFQRVVLPRGTTGAVCDPHELTNVQGISALSYFLSEAAKLSMDLRVMLSSCVPATDLETNGAGHVRAEDLAVFRTHPRALGLAEMMNVPGVLHGDEEVTAKLEMFSDGIIDGHCPLLQGRELSAYAAAGISSCHESTRLEEAREKLTKGLAVWVREGSVAKDLHALIPLLDAASSPNIGFCTDDRNPYDIATEGHLDFLVREAIRSGVAPEIVYRSASWSVARHYGMRGKGAVAPGYDADLVVLDDVATCAVSQVLCGGRLVSEMELPAGQSENFPNTIRARVPEVADLRGPEGRVHVIGVEAGKILTTHHVLAHDHPGVARLSVLERYGRHSPPANGYVLGFGEGFRGAIASSVGHDSHNLIVVGSDPEDMRTALAALAECGGGFCVVGDRKVLARLPLPFGGLMSARDEKDLVRDLLALKKASREIGCVLEEPFLQLAFLSLPVIPSLKLTDRGLVDVEQFRFIDVRAA